MIPLVVASERGLAQTRGACSSGVVGPGIWKLQNDLLAEWCGKAYHRG
jgi:hypothetical protein